MVVPVLVTLVPPLAAGVMHGASRPGVMLMIRMRPGVAACSGFGERYFGSPAIDSLRSVLARGLANLCERGSDLLHGRLCGVAVPDCGVVLRRL